jgi:ArsR family transcriptional regulator
MISENLLGDIFEECIPLFIALGDRTRLTILQCLFETQTTGEGRIPGLNVNEITDRTSLSRPAVSHHLKILKDTGLIDVLRKVQLLLSHKQKRHRQARSSERRA